ncbi:hypothetical protein [Bdellovibrio sp. HCB274]|uniref:hypothetical protein n=1 Tax=Bdellovibrio sp. HCB274 TaxID=3394361 RepID=UPI0039B469F2
MHKILFNLMIVILGVPAFACPELSGQFDCEGTTGPVNTFIFSSGTERGQAVYYVNGTKLVANGIPETRNRGDAFPSVYTATCAEQSLNTRIQTSVSSSICPSMPLAVESLTVFTRKGEQIEMDDRTILRCPGKETMNIHHVYTCKRK